MTTSQQSIAAIAAGSPDFEILTRALETAGLTGAVADGQADLTVFAPTDAAFATLASDLGFAGDAADEDAVFTAIADTLATLAADGDPVPLLSEILLTHVAAGALTAEEIAARDSLATLSGATLAPEGARLVDAEPDLLDPAVTLPDIAAANGIVQGIDRVLLPLDIPGNDTPTIAEIAAGNGDFEVLTLALEAAGLTSALDDPDSALTAFAPTDAAFAALAQDLGFTGDTDDAQAVFDALAGALSDLAEDGDPVPLLTDILLAHVAEDASSRAALVAAPQIATLGGATVIPSEAGIFDADPEAEDAAFINGLTDIAASNGLVQAIDRVILPLDLADPAPSETIADLVAASGGAFDDDPGDFDLLLTALQTAGLVGALGDADDAFTVAAPTDAAFTELAVTFGADPADEADAFDAIVATLTALAPDDDPVPLLSDVLLYHVVEGVFPRVALAEGPALTSLFGPAPAADGAGLVDADPAVADPRFIDPASDIVAANGIVQGLDRVLLPADLPEVVASGGPGDDTIPVGESTAAVMGGAGADAAVFDLPLSDAAFAAIDGGVAVETGAGSVALMEVESIRFADATLEVDESESAAQAARLFEAGLGRAGAPGGLAFLAEIVSEKGLDAAADTVIQAEEFTAQFGANPSHGDYVDALFLNVLGREARPEGRAFWSDVLDSGATDVPGLLTFFSESPEFREQTADLTDDGVLLLA